MAAHGVAPLNEEAAKEVAKVVAEGGGSATRGRVRGIHESQMRWIRPSLPYFCFRRKTGNGGRAQIIAKVAPSAKPVRGLD